MSQRSPGASLGGTASALTRYRVMAFIVGTGLAVLCFIGIPLQIVGMLVRGHDVFAGSSWAVGAGWPWTAVVAVVGTAHGFLYMVYLLACLDLAARARFRTVQLVGMVCSGLLPLLAFYMEHKVTQRVKAQLALGEDAPPGPAASLWAVLVRRPGRPRPQSQGEPVAAGLPDQEIPADSA